MSVIGQSQPRIYNPRDIYMLQYLGETLETTQDMLAKAAPIFLTIPATLEWKKIGVGFYWVQLVSNTPFPEDLVQQLEKLEWVKYFSSPPA